MDADITGAATQLDLNKIVAQDERAHRAAMLKVAQDLMAWIQVQYAGLVAVEDAAYKRELILALVAKYMTTGTAVDPVLIAKDASDDAKRLSAALAEVLKL